MPHEIPRSIMQSRFRKLSKQDFVVISELAGVCDDSYKYPLLVSRLTAIARVLHNKRGPGQSRAVKVIRHVQRLRN
jgi:hypothetical protein